MLGMTSKHLECLSGHPDRASRGFLLGGLVEGSAEIPDPVLEGADFGRTFERIAFCVERLVERLRGRSEQLDLDA